MRSKVSGPLLTARQFGLVCISVLATVLAHAAHLPWTLLGLIVLTLIGRWLQRQRQSARVSAWIKLPLMLLFPILVYTHYGNVFGREPGSALACAMLALKLLETETQRDARAAIGFSSFVLMSALLFDTTLIFTLALFAALTLLLATLRELEPKQPSANTEPLRGAMVRDLRSAGFALLSALPLATCAFLFFPRLDSPMWRTPGDASARTGMSDSMSPGSIQDLLLDDSPAFRVSFDGPRPARAQLYWRGPVLTDFDGATWTRHNVPPARGAALKTLGTTVAYEVTLEPNDKPWLFALDMPLDAPPGSLRSADMSLLRARAVTDLLRYRMQSVLGYQIDTTLAAEQRAAALALPAGFNPRSIELANGWRRDFNNDQRIVRAALGLFHEAFSYTLAPAELGRDSVDDFLFRTKQGFCEHFASAFVFLMRAAGVPARVVTGYQGGYFNDVGKYLLVRQSDAHAWSEIWLDGKGWVRVDPTAAVSPQRVELGAQALSSNAGVWSPGNWLLSVRNQLDLVNRGWNNLIVQFNAARQRNLLTPFGVNQADFATLTWVLIATTTVPLCLVALWIMRTPRQRIEPLDMAYITLCAKLAKAGVARAPNEGPFDYARRVQDAGSLPGPAVRQAQALLTHYADLRYAAAAAADDAVVATFARSVRRWRIARR